MSVQAPLVLAWCDDLFVQGHVFAAWITDYIDLEHSLAMGSISQELLAHSSALMGACGLKAVDRDERIFRRSPHQWFASRIAPVPGADWPSTVASGFLLSQAALTMRTGLSLPPQPQNGRLADVIAAEQDSHAVFWERWLGVFARTPSIRNELVAALEGTGSAASDVFGLPLGEEVEDQLIVVPRLELHRTWATRVKQILGVYGFDLPGLEDEPTIRQPDGAAVERMLTDLVAARGAGGVRLFEVYR